MIGCSFSTPIPDLSLLDVIITQVSNSEQQRDISEHFCCYFTGSHTEVAGILSQSFLCSLFFFCK